MRILVATDGSEYSLAAARKAAEFVNFGASSTITVLSVVEPIPPMAPFGVSDEYYVQAREASTKSAIAAVAETAKVIEEALGGGQVEIDTRTGTGKPGEVILEEAERLRTDLIIVGSHGRGFWGRMLLGSVSGSIVRHAHCSVLVVRSEVENEQ
ncbi:MAG: universal stress protein [Pyrinomonadaceae bacterium]